MKFSLFDTTHWPFGMEPSDFDAAKAARIFEEHLVEYQRADELGYDTIFLAEHHFSPYNLTPNPMVMLAAVAQRTSRIRMGVMVNVLPFHDPIRWAEEVAMLDLLSNGRLEVGIGRGVDEQEFLKFKMPYPEARPRFEEGLALAMRLWSETEVAHDGQFYRLGTGTMWPRPIQQPHPPIWVAALSDSTLAWAGSHGYRMASAFLPPDITRNRFDIYRQAAADAGHSVDPGDTALLRFVHVGETDAQAKAEASESIAHLFKLFVPAVVPQNLDALPEDYSYYKEFFAPFQALNNLPPPEVLMDLGILVAGAPETVEKNLRHQIETSTSGHLLLWHNYGSLTHQSVLRSEELLATKVIPNLRELQPTI